MKAIVDILKENNLYTFMSVKETLLLSIDNLLKNTEYAGLYGISGTFASSNQTISIVVGVLEERQGREFLSMGMGHLLKSPVFRMYEYTYGINITGINDEEVRKISRHVHYEIGKITPQINRELGVRMSPNIHMNPVISRDVGEKRMWSVNMFVSVTVNEPLLRTSPCRAIGRTESEEGGLNVEGYIPPKNCTCVVL